MKRILFLFFCFFVFSNTNAQQTFYTIDEDMVEYNDADVRPEFPAPYESFMDFIAKNFSLPDYEGMGGVLKVSFMIETDGTVSNFKVVKNVDSESSNEIKKVMAKCPQWKPGEHNGKVTRIFYEFSLKIMSQS